MYDVVVIGAGVTGCAIARELTKKKRKVLVVDRASDVCEGTSKANSGIIHAGHDAKPGSMKAKMNVRGNSLMDQLAKDLDIPFKRNGSLVLCFDKDDEPKLEKLYNQGVENGVTGLRIIDPAELKEIEPNISSKVTKALFAPTGGIVCPFNMTIALAENASVNGAEFMLNTEVTDVKKAEDGYEITVKKTGKRPGEASDISADEKIKTHIVINAAGVYADKIHNMVSDKKLHITARKGEYMLMDKKVGDFVEKTIFQLPTALGKGILVTPTVHGNLLVGPTAVDTENKEEINTTADGYDAILKMAVLSADNLPSVRNTITSFAGLRAHEDGGDFILAEAEDAKGFIDAAGIESPGLSSAPAIGEYIAAIVDSIDNAPDNTDFIATRKGIKSMALASAEEREKLVSENPLYANVICRCELVTEGEIVDSINRPLGATTLDGVKRRTRAGMGRCQAGFCSPKTVEILARELNCDMSEITKCGGESAFLVDTDNVKFSENGGVNRE